MKKFFKYSWMLVLPAVVAAAVIWNASATPDGRCPEVDPLDHTVLLPNPADCTSFYSCSDGVAILMHCPDGLYFNSKLDVCDWPQNVDCTILEQEYSCHSSSKKGNNGETYTRCDDCKSHKGIGTGTEGTCKKTTMKS